MTTSDAKSAYRESASILKEIGDRNGLAAPLRNLGVIAGIQKAYAEANEFFEESLAIDRQLNNQRGIAHSLQNLGVSAVRGGEYRKAEEYLREAVAISSELGFRRLLAFCLNALGEVSAAQDDAPKARQLYHQALRIALEIDETPLVLEILLGIARLRTRAAEYETAAELLALIQHHAASEGDTRDAANELVEDLSPSLPPNVLRAALERGRATELARAAQRVLADSSSASLAARE